MRPDLAGHAAMLAFSALVAGSFALGGMIANLISPLALTAVRFALAALAIAALALATTGLPLATFRAPWRFALLGGVFAIYFVLMFEGLKTATSVSTAAVFTLTPVMSAGFGYLLLGQRMTRRLGLALGLGAAGALWVIFRGDVAALLRFDIGRGETVFFAGCIAHALYTPLVRRLNRGESPVVFPVGTFVAGALIVALIGARDIAATDWLALPALVWVVLAYLAVVTSALTLILLQFASFRLPSAKVMAYTYLTPAFVILWEVALGGAAPPWRMVIGVVVTALALALMLKDEERGSASAGQPAGEG